MNIFFLDKLTYVTFHRRDCGSYRYSTFLVISDNLSEAWILYNINHAGVQLSSNKASTLVMRLLLLVLV